MDAAIARSELSRAPSDVIFLVLQSMDLTDRLTCALVCKAWAQAATAATRSIILPDRVQDLSCLQCWLDKHGSHMDALQLHKCHGAALTALPCPQLQDLLLNSFGGSAMVVSSRAWGDISAATKLTSISLCHVLAPSRADVVSALTALRDLKRLTWNSVQCSKADLPDSVLLQQMTRLTYLELRGASSAALQHLSLLTKLQHLTIDDVDGSVAADPPGLQELKALTSLKLYDVDDIPASVSQLTALQQLEVWRATAAAAAGLQVLTALTELIVWRLRGLSAQSPQLQLTGLQHLYLRADQLLARMPMSYVASCKQLRVLSLHGFPLRGPGSLVASTLLQHLELSCCALNETSPDGRTAADGAAEPVSWQQVLPGPGQLPHLTSLQLSSENPCLEQSDLEHMVAACCSSLQVLRLGTLQDSFAPALARLPALSSLLLSHLTDAQCAPLAQVTGLKELRVAFCAHLSTIGLQQLAALKQLTSLGIFGGYSSEQVSPILREVLLDKLPGCSHAIVNKVCADDTREGLC